MSEYDIDLPGDKKKPFEGSEDATIASGGALTGPEDATMVSGSVKDLIPEPEKPAEAPPTPQPVQAAAVPAAAPEPVYADPYTPEPSFVSSPPPQQPAAPKDNKKTWIIVAVVVLLVLCCCCGVIGIGVASQPDILKELGISALPFSLLI